MRKLFKYAILVTVISSCTKDRGYVSTGNFPSEVGRIIGTSCAVSGCHTNASREIAGGISLESWDQLFEGSSSGSPVIPRSSRFSPLMYFINTYDEFGLQSEPTMPLNRAPLSRDEVATISSWINSGAPDSQGNVKWTGNPDHKKLYAVNQGCDVVTVLDAASGLPVRYVQVGLSSSSDAPHHLRVSPDGKFWYVVFINSPFMQKYRCSDDTYVGDIPLTPYVAGLTPDAEQNALDWNAFVISADGKRAYCTSWTQNGKVSVVDLDNMRFVRWIGGQHFPHGIALNHAGDKIYVSAQTGNFITEIDTALSTATTISLDGAISYASSLDIHDMILSEDGKDLLVTCQKSNEVRVLDLTTKQLKATISTGLYPQEIVYSKKMQRYYVSCTGDTSTFAGANGVITGFDAISLSPVSLACGFQPHGIAVNELTNTLFVLSRNLSDQGVPSHHGSVCNGRNGFLSFVDLNSFKVKPGSYELSVDPYFIFPRP